MPHVNTPPIELDERDEAILMWADLKHRIRRDAFRKPHRLLKRLNIRRFAGLHQPAPPGQRLPTVGMTLPKFSQHTLSDHMHDRHLLSHGLPCAINLPGDMVLDNAYY